MLLLWLIHVDVWQKPAGEAGQGLERGLGKRDWRAWVREEMSGGWGRG